VFHNIDLQQFRPLQTGDKTDQKRYRIDQNRAQTMQNRTEIVLPILTFWPRTPSGALRTRFLVRRDPQKRVLGYAI
ncbi:MAG: hypothetical protein NT049_02045, partial [Planctomycetota bacterium]|nr:hypothetical protein [Planctomycetota bacterium]